MMDLSEVCMKIRKESVESTGSGSSRGSGKLRRGRLSLSSSGRSTPNRVLLDAEKNGSLAVGIPVDTTSVKVEPSSIDEGKPENSMFYDSADIESSSLDMKRDIYEHFTDVLNDVSPEDTIDDEQPGEVVDPLGYEPNTSNILDEVSDFLGFDEQTIQKAIERFTDIWAIYEEWRPDGEPRVKKKRSRKSITASEKPPHVDQSAMIEIPITTTMGISNNTTLDTPNTTTLDIPKTATLDISKPLSDIPKTTTLDISKPTTLNIPKTATEEILKTRLKNIPKITSDKILKSTLKNIPKITTEEIPKTTTDEISKTTAVEIPLPNNDLAVSCESSSIVENQINDEQMSVEKEIDNTVKEESIDMDEHKEKEEETVSDRSLLSKEVVLEKSNQKPDAVKIKEVSNEESSPSTPTVMVNGKKKTEITSSLYKEPFKQGWKRELVYRSQKDESRPKIPDVYYYSPNGKKYKSIGLLAAALSGSSTLKTENFTFRRDLILSGSDPEKEFVRDSKFSKSDRRSTTAAAKPVEHEETNPFYNRPFTIDNPFETSSVSGYEVPSPLTVACGSGFSKSPPSTRNLKRKLDSSSDEWDCEDGDKDDEPPRKMPANLSTGRGPLVSLPRTSGYSSKGNALASPKGLKLLKPEKRSSLSQHETEDLITPQWKSSPPFKPSSVPQKRVSQSPSTAKKAKTIVTTIADTTKPSINKTASRNSSAVTRERPSCSIMCPAAPGVVPTLQCTSCLCLYHTQCCGQEAGRKVAGYICKRCEMDQEEQLKKSLQPTSSSLFSRPSTSLSTASLATMKPTKSQKIVDGLTTWLPASSNIHLSSKPDVTTDGGQPILQSVLEMNGKRFIVVPKQSILSVSNLSAGSSDAQDKASEETTPEPDPQSSPAEGPGVLLVPVQPSDEQQMVVMKKTVTRTLNTSDSSSSKLTTATGKKTSDEEHISSTTVKCDASSLPASALSISSISALYDSIMGSLKYLTVKELLRVAVTNKFFNHMVSNPALWKTVRLKNSKVYDWEGMADALRKHGTVRLDMRKMLAPTDAQELTRMWSEFVRLAPTLPALRHVDLCRCSAHIVDQLAAGCPQLTVINAQFLKNDIQSVKNIRKLSKLKELRLKGVSGIQIVKGAINQFVNKDALQVLSLTNFKNLDYEMVRAISGLTNLTTLELGECVLLPPYFAADTIAPLTRLEKLRLEKVQNMSPEYELFKVLKVLPHLKKLELINFEVKAGFENALSECSNVREFLIIPTYMTQSATTNQLIINGIKRLSSSLDVFVWGLTLELLRVTDLFMDQWKEQKSGGTPTPAKRTPGDSIPILKSVDKVEGEVAASQVDILPIPKMEKMLAVLLPNTRIKVLKVPFSSTWRQSLADAGR